MKLKRLIVALLVATTSIASYAQEANCTPYIEVRGEASAMLKPNKIEVQISLSEEPSKGKVSLASQESTLAKALKAAGVDIKKQLTVTGQSSDVAKRNDTYQYKTFSLMLTSPEEVQAVFDQLSAHSIADARITKLSNDDTEMTRNKLRVEAMQEAQKIAATLSAGVGQSIGAAIQIIDYSGGGDATTYADGMMLMRSNAKAMTGGIPDDLGVKQIELNQSVTVRFLLLPATAPESE